MPEVLPDLAATLGASSALTRDCIPLPHPSGHQQGQSGCHHHRHGLGGRQRRQGQVPLQGRPEEDGQPEAGAQGRACRCDRAEAPAVDPHQAPPLRNSTPITMLRCVSAAAWGQKAMAKTPAINANPCQVACFQVGGSNKGPPGERGGWPINPGAAGMASNTTVQAGSITRCSRAMCTGSKIRLWPGMSRGIKLKAAMGR